MDPRTGRPDGPGVRFSMLELSLENPGFSPDSGSCPSLVRVYFAS
ncbi:hypothetical protein FH063_002692 [Azospirillum argentinense]|uniref:Uncharacterized protein n=1 Tax=Azospirillum argentinense TaxID=2970906 RepID=A0A5B0KNH5_9PROT|nr:hypothetical protein FH063_002692 [Azospirillum argentinense]